MEFIEIYFNPTWVAYFVSLAALIVAGYAVYLVLVLGDYVESLKRNIKNSNALYEEQNKYTTKTKRK